MDSERETHVTDGTYKAYTWRHDNIKNDNVFVAFRITKTLEEFSGFETISLCPDLQFGTLEKVLDAPSATPIQTIEPKQSVCRREFKRFQKHVVNCWLTSCSNNIAQGTGFAFPLLLQLHFICILNIVIFTRLCTRVNICEGVHCDKSGKNVDFARTYWPNDHISSASAKELERFTCRASTPHWVVRITCSWL